MPSTGKKCALNSDQDLTKGQSSKQEANLHVVSNKKLHKTSSKPHQDALFDADSSSDDEAPLVQNVSGVKKKRKAVKKKMATSTEASSDDEMQENMQQQILLQLQHRNQGLGEVEQHVARVEQYKGSKDSLKLSKSQCSGKLLGKDSVCHKSRVFSSSDESDVPDMSY